MVGIPSVQSKESKPFWKRKSFWVIVIIAAIVVISVMGRLGGSSNKVSDGLDSTFYKKSVAAYNEYKKDYENRELPNKDIAAWVANQDVNRSPSQHPDQYTSKENYILDRLGELTADITMFKAYGEVSGDDEGKIEDNLTKLAKILGVKSPNFSKKNEATPSNNNQSYTYNKPTNQQAISGLYSQNENNGNPPSSDTGSTQPDTSSPSPHQYTGVNDVDEYGVTQLAHAADNNDVQQVKELLGKGADPNLQKGMGEPPLLWAIRGNHEDIVKILLNAGANPNYKSSEGATPLSIAKANKENAIVQDLLKYGAK